MNSEHSLSPAGEIARTGDPERFYAALFAPAQTREALFALLAFNYEIARVREVVHDTTLGEMRLAWWHEALDEIDASRPVRAHPVAQALAASNALQPIPLDRLRTLIDARSFDLYGEPMADLTALETYAAATGGGLHCAMAVSLGGTAEELVAAEACGTAWALTGIVRALGIHSSRRQLFVPMAELQSHGIDTELVFAGAKTEGLRAVIGHVIARARTHYVEARKIKMHRALAAVLPGALLPAHWRRIGRKDYDPFRFAAEPSQLSTMGCLLVAAATGKI